MKLSVFSGISRKFLGGAVLFAVFVSPVAVQAAPDLEAIWKIVQQQQQQIDDLQSALTASQRRLEEAQQRLLARGDQQARRLDAAESNLEATVSHVETMTFGETQTDTRIGGYGELHYNNLDNGDQIDFHRFVLFLSHQFTDNLSLHSEVEIEHSLAGDGKPGEVELEQAFVQWDYAPGHHTKLGLFLVPVGIMNETHEPDTFFGVERNEVEKNILPSTWWEAGVGFSGEVAPGWNYDLALHSGLNLDSDNASGARRSSIRSARQKVAEANADSLAYTARMRYSGIPGLQISAAIQRQTDLTQGDDDAVGIGSISATLFETNLQYQSGSFGLRALYAAWDIDNEINLLNAGADEQSGWYVEPSWRFAADFGVFARYGSYDLNAGNSVASNEKQQIDIGINYWLHERVVIKADFQRQDNDTGQDVDGFNLGFGYSF